MYEVKTLPRWYNKNETVHSLLYCRAQKQTLCLLNNYVVSKQKCIDYVEKMTLNDHFFDSFFLKKSPSFKILMSGWAGIGCQATSYSKLYVTFILQWIAFIFGRVEKEDQ